MDLLHIFSNTNTVQEFAEGDVVFAEGDPGDLMYVIIEGDVAIRVGDGNIASYSAGEIFGEMALIDTRPRSARAVATSPLRVARVDEDVFKFLVAENPSFSLHVMRVLVDRLRKSDPRLWQE